MKTIHLIPNAHLDQVWLWDWREGYNETIATAQAMCDLLERFPELTFARGEANFYEPIVKYRPDLLERIKALVAEGRWELVGGNYVQTDNNFPSTATFLQQYRRGKAFFKRVFGVDVETAWSADSAGHALGLPELFSHAGLKYFSFARPASNALQLSNESFVWKGPSGAEILCARGPYGYQNERTGTIELIQMLLKDQANYPQENLYLPMGLGDHGGGPSARHVEEVREFAASQTDIRIQFSTFGRFFKALETEKAVLPVVTGELNLTMHGVYLTNLPIKHNFRDLEATLQRANRTCQVIDHALGTPTQSDFGPLFDDMLFNTFHDILPGDSIERVNREQVRWMGSAWHLAEQKEYDALTRLIGVLDMQVPVPGKDKPTAVPFLIFNPSPVPYDGSIELEGTLDYRPLWDAWNKLDTVVPDLRDENGNPIPCQIIDTEHYYMPDLPWRLRVLFQLQVPPFGYRRVTIGRSAATAQPVRQPQSTDTAAPSSTCISNSWLKCRIENDRIFLEKSDGSPVAAKDGIGFATFQDRYGCWGSMGDEYDAWHCENKIEDWKVSNVKLLESGPERSMLFASWKGGRSQLDVKISLHRNLNALKLEGMFIWQERDQRLRMSFSPVSQVTYQVPAGIINRSKFGDVPGQRWLKTPEWGLASDHFSSYTSLENGFHVNLVRGCLDCTDQTDSATAHPERMAVDAGRHYFKCLITPCPETAPALAGLLEFPPMVLQGWAHKGLQIPDTQLTLPDSNLVLLDLRRNGASLDATLQNLSANTIDADFNGRQVTFAPWQILDIPNIKK